MGEQLSMLDTMFLELEQADEGAHMHIGAALVFGPTPSWVVPDVSAVRERVRSRLGHLPRFAQRLSAVHAGPMTWLTWEPASEVDLEAHVRHARLPAPGGERELHEWLADFWSHRLDRRRPLWEMVLLDGLPGERWALATKTHHCLVDGVGSIDIGHVLLDVAPDAPAPAAAQAGSGAGGRSWLEPGSLLRGARAGLGAARHPRTTLERARAAAELVVREEVVPAPHTSLNVPTSGIRAYASVGLDLDEVKEVKRALGGTVNDVVLGVCAGALRHLLLARGEAPPDRDLRAQVPVNVRAGEKEHALGNELTSLFVELPVGEPDARRRHELVVARAEALKAGTQRDGGTAILELADLAPPLVGALLGRTMFGSSRMFNLTITNVPGPRERLHAFAAPLQEALPFVPLFAGHAVGIAAASYAGRIVFGLSTDRLAVPEVDVLAEGVRDAFAQVRAASRAPATA